MCSNILLKDWWWYDNDKKKISIELIISFWFWVGFVIYGDY